MSTIADVERAIRDADGSGWQIADALAELPEVDDDGTTLTLKVIAQRIWEDEGVEWSPAVLGSYRATAAAFPIALRSAIVSFQAHRELRAHPEKLTTWARRHPGKVLTVEAARSLRGPRSAAKQPTIEARAGRLLRQLDDLVFDDPTTVLELVEEAAARWRAKYAKRIEKVKRGLRVV